MTKIRITLLAFGFIIGGCATTKKSYSDTEELLVVGHGWSDSDNQIAARKIVTKALMSPWLKNHKKPPRVGVDRVKNSTMEELDTEALVNFMQDELINSGKVEFIAIDEATQSSIDSQISSQEMRTRKSERVEAGNQSGIEYLFQGVISSKEEQDDDLKIVNYQVNFKLISLSTSKIVWSGQHRLRKKFER